MCTVHKLAFPLKTPVIDVLQRHWQIIMKDKRKKRKREKYSCSKDLCHGYPNSHRYCELQQVFESMYSKVCMLKMYQVDSTGHCLISLVLVS